MNSTERIVDQSPCITDFVEVTLHKDGRTFRRKLFVYQGELIELKAKGEAGLDTGVDSECQVDNFFFLVGREAEKIL